MSDIKVCNDRIFGQLSLASDCAEALHRMGCRVLDIRMGGHAPVIEIEDGEGRVEGALYMRETQHGQTVATYVARLYHCQVRWKARHAQRRVAA